MRELSLWPASSMRELLTYVHCLSVLPVSITVKGPLSADTHAPGDREAPACDATVTPLHARPPSCVEGSTHEATHA